MEKALLCTRLALDRKAHDLQLLDVSKLTSVADYFLICTGRSDTQVRAIAQHIEEGLRAVGVQPLAQEGTSRGQWVLMDYGDVVVHVFYQPIRAFYDLEGLWRKALRVRLPEPYYSQARSFVTGTEGY
ncbi:MAG: ribosome silencing factor [Deltaproteobacteria bacterium]|nr:ribosome silencing factor [Deltaproteobacteria bacterium]